MPNRLINETSPYLLQHANNPVDWYPWGQEALSRARDEDKPILLSIGYSACHWCHVMERESFENDAIAGIMNDHFINIKVDREERPDLDAVYMEAVQMLTGSGGWPMTVFLTPDCKPFLRRDLFPSRRPSEHARVPAPAGDGVSRLSQQQLGDTARDRPVDRTDGTDREHAARVGCIGRKHPAQCLQSVGYQLRLPEWRRRLRTEVPAGHDPGGAAALPRPRPQRACPVHAGSHAGEDGAGAASTTRPGAVSTGTPPMRSACAPLREDALR